MTDVPIARMMHEGGYTTGLDALGNEALVEGDQASHVFDVIWPFQSTPSAGIFEG